MTTREKHPGLTKALVRQLHRENKTWPEELKLIPKPWPNVPPDMRTGSEARVVWRSRRFLVVLWAEPNGWLRLSVQRTEYDLDTLIPRDGITWDDLQRLKREAGFGAACAVELYPPEGDVVDVAAMRHLFILPAPPPFMWIDGKSGPG